VCIREQQGDAALSATVAFEAGWWTSPAGSREQWDRREQPWDSGQEVLWVDYEEGGITLWRLADLLLEDVFSVEE
jgi:hypothetical protein